MPIWPLKYGLAVLCGWYASAGVGEIMVCGGISFCGDHKGWRVNFLSVGQRWIGLYVG